MKFTLQTLTPLHTGGVNAGQMDRIHETGIIGSLRWWYEALVRGLGRDVCNPTSPSQNERCSFDDEKYRKAKGKPARKRVAQAGICDVCQVFGATGWARLFRLVVEMEGEKLWASDEKIQVTAPDGKRGWHFYSPQISTSASPIEINIVRRAGFDASTQNDLAVLISLISRWGSLGAKTQHGFGAVNIADITDSEGKPITPDLDLFYADERFSGDCLNDQDLPALSNMFFARLYIKEDIDNDWWEKANLDHRGIRDRVAEWRLNETTDPVSVPIAPAVKYRLRYGEGNKSWLSKKDENYFFGDVKSKPSQKSKLNISNAYQGDGGRWQFRLWGWLPQSHSSRDQHLERLYKLVTEDRDFWKHIFNDDIVCLDESKWADKSGEKNAQIFLSKLLKNKAKSK